LARRRTALSQPSRPSTCSRTCAPRACATRRPRSRFACHGCSSCCRRRGALALVADIERNVEASDEKDLLVETLKLALPGLIIGDGDEAADSLLPGQVVGRIDAKLGAKWPDTLGALRGECWDWRGPRDWMRPVRAYFTAPGGPLEGDARGAHESV
jgi:hypothetical protein